MSSTSSAALERSASGSSELGCVPLPSARTTLDAELSSHIIGLMSRSTRMSASSAQIDWVSPSSSSPGASPASRIAPRPAAETSPWTSGPSSCESSASSDPIGSLLRTSLESDMTALTGCAVTLSSRATPSGRSISILRYRRDSVAEFASSGWPTPTETANHDAPSMRKWPAYARYQDAVRRTTVRLWEWMMDFPAGWLDCMRSETPSPQPPPSSSGEPS